MARPVVADSHVGLWLLLAGALVAVLWGSAPGVSALWVHSQGTAAGVVGTGQITLTSSDDLIFDLDGEAFDPTAQVMCVGDTVRVGVPVSAVATGTNMAPVLTRTTTDLSPADATVTDVNLDAINIDLVVAESSQDHLVQFDVTSSAASTVHLSQELTLSAGPDSPWSSTLSLDLVPLVFERCGGDLVTTWDTTLTGDSGPHVSMTFAEVGPRGLRIDFGNGVVTTAGAGQTGFSYDVPGTYTVTVSGVFGSVRFDGSDALVSVDRWDAATGATSIAEAFKGADNITRIVSPPTTVTDMRNAFEDSAANPQLVAWDTSNVTSMAYMFSRTATFNQDIGGWNTSSVTHMGGMFSLAVAFDQDIGAWDTSKVTRTEYMFNQARSFNQDLDGWRTSKVSNMIGMFTGAAVFNGDIGAWDTSSATHMTAMFDGAVSFDQDIGAWVTSQVTDMSRMFLNAPAFDQDIGGWDTANVSNMNVMFRGARAFDQDLSAWDTSRVRNMGGMFWSADAFDGGLGTWNTSNVTDIGDMFRGAARFNQDVGAWDTSNVVRMSHVFAGAAAFNQDIGGWDTSRVTSMNSMFQGAAAFNRDIGGWDTSRVTDMSFMFTQARSFAGALDAWNVVLIGQEPVDFRVGADPAMVSPVWGTSGSWPTASDPLSPQMIAEEDGDSSTPEPGSGLSEPQPGVAESEAGTVEPVPGQPEGPDDESDGLDGPVVSHAVPRVVQGPPRPDAR